MVGGQSSNATTWSYTPPTINTLKPTVGPTKGGITLTLQGVSLGGPTQASVLVGGSVCVIATATKNDTYLECALPAGRGVNQAVSVTVDGQLSNSLLFDYLPPSVALVNPPNGPTDGQSCCCKHAFAYMLYV